MKLFTDWKTGENNLYLDIGLNTLLKNKCKDSIVWLYQKYINGINIPSNTSAHITFVDGKIDSVRLQNNNCKHTKGWEEYIFGQITHTEVRTELIIKKKIYG